jgi:Putative zinc-finger
MTHPDDLLAEYEDGALADGERAVLERHLATCARCRDEVALAQRARRALADLPDAEAAPTIGGTAIQRASEGSKRPVWYRWGAVAAGVAAAIVALALILPNVGSVGADRAQPAAASAEAGASGPPTTVSAATGIEHQGTDYDAMSVAELARSYGGRAYAVSLSAGGQNQVPAPQDSSFGSASTCLAQAAGSGEGVLIRLVDARFQGTPAFLGVYLTSPGAGQPADAVRVLVVRKDDCSRVLSSAWAKL